MSCVHLLNASTSSLNASFWSPQRIVAMIHGTDVMINGSVASIKCVDGVVECIDVID
jgi:hypothetical protein